MIPELAQNFRPIAPARIIDRTYSKDQHHGTRAVG